MVGFSQLRGTAAQLEKYATVCKHGNERALTRRIRAIVAAVMSARAAYARLRDAAESGALAALCDRHRIRLVTVFGSVVYAEITGDDIATATPPPRDLDIAVFFDPAAVKVGSTKLMEVVNDLVDLTLFDHVDVMVLNRAGPVAKDQALSLGVPLFEADAGMYARMQMAASTQRMDTAHLRRGDLELMAEGSVLR